MKALEIEFVKGTLHVNGRPASAWVEDVERLEAEKAAAAQAKADALEAEKAAVGESLADRIGAL